jgi:hypothetical protein
MLGVTYKIDYSILYIGLQRAMSNTPAGSAIRRPGRSTCSFPPLVLVLVLVVPISLATTVKQSNMVEQRPPPPGNYNTNTNNNHNDDDSVSTEATPTIQNNINIAATTIEDGPELLPNQNDTNHNNNNNNNNTMMDYTFQDTNGQLVQTRFLQFLYS